MTAKVGLDVEDLLRCPGPDVNRNRNGDAVAGHQRHTAFQRAGGEVLGQLLEVAGEPLTMTELASALQAARGWHGTLRHIPRPVLRALGTLARPANPAFARKNRAALAMDTTELPTRTDAADLLGRAPLQVRDVLTDSKRAEYGK